jgi:hypothetical protein
MMGVTDACYNVRYEDCDAYDVCCNHCEVGCLLRFVLTMRVTKRATMSATMCESYDGSHDACYASLLVAGEAVESVDKGTVASFCYNACCDADACYRASYKECFDLC